MNIYQWLSICTNCHWYIFISFMKRKWKYTSESLYKLDSQNGDKLRTTLSLYIFLFCLWNFPVFPLWLRQFPSLKSRYGKQECITVETRYKDIWYNKISDITNRFLRCQWNNFLCFVLFIDNWYNTTIWYNKQNFLVPRISLYRVSPVYVTSYEVGTRKQTNQKKITKQLNFVYKGNGELSTTFFTIWLSPPSAHLFF